MPCELYGVVAVDLDATAVRLAARLGLVFEPRESSFLGLYWLHEGADGGEILIYYNEGPKHYSGSDPWEKRFFEPDFARFRILLDAQCLSEQQLRLSREAVLSEFPGSALIRHV